MSDKVKIKSLVKGTIVINNSDLRIKRVWERKGAVKTIDLDVLQELIYDPGVEYMFTQGILGIEDFKVKQLLGLEPEDVEKPTNIIVFDDNMMDRLMTKMPLNEFKAAIKKAPREQILNLVDYAIEKEYTDFEKCEFLKELVGRDIITAIKINRKDKEDVGPILD